MIYAVLLLIVVMGIVFVFTLDKSDKGVPSSSYTYLKYKDGTYIGVEKTELGNIKTEVAIESEKIRDIRLVEFPANFLAENELLQDEIPQMLFEVIQTQNIVVPEASDNSAYVLNKILKSIRSALDQSLLE